MTNQSTFKSKIRARMLKTKERYAAARLALLNERTADTDLSRRASDLGYVAVPAVHGDTARLTSALSHAGVTDLNNAALAEDVVFVLTGGIGFMYFLFEYKDSPPLMSLICRSWSLPWPMVERALTHADIAFDVVETTSEKKAGRSLDDVLDRELVAHLTVDAGSLPWTGTDPQWKGQIPRQLNVVGREGDTYLVDDGQLREMDSGTLAEARAAVRKQKHRLVSFPSSTSVNLAHAMLPALRYTAQSFVESPFKGFVNNFGLRGLAKAAKLTHDVKDKKSWHKVFSSGPLAHRALVRTWECIHLDFTPPAAGRAFYAQGLRQLMLHAHDDKTRETLAQAADLTEASGHQWEQLAETAVDVGGATVRAAIDVAEEMETLARAGNAPERIVALRQKRAEIAQECELDEPARAAAFDAVSSAFTKIEMIERSLVEILSTL